LHRRFRISGGKVPNSHKKSWKQQNVPSFQAIICVSGKKQVGGYKQSCHSFQLVFAALTAVFFFVDFYDSIEIYVAYVNTFASGTLCQCSGGGWWITER